MVEKRENVFEQTISFVDVDKESMREVMLEMVDELIAEIGDVPGGIDITISGYPAKKNAISESKGQD